MRQILSAFLCLSSLFCLPSANAQQKQAFQSDTKFTTTLAEAKRLASQRDYIFAIDSYKKANKIAGGQCIDCLNQIFTLQIKIGNFKDAASTSTAIEALATTPNDKSLAKTERGQALYYQAGDKGKPELLNAAHAAFQSALSDHPKNAQALFLDGHVLAKLGKIDEARDEFKACLSCVSPKDPSYVRAQHFAENPALSLAKMAPAFTVTALDGSTFNLDEMGGRVVLIDFWATWCGPCNAELPHMKKIAKEFAGQPLVIISVSWDSDAAKWKDFINKNEMTWVQYRDADHSLSNAFGVQAIPHYFTIDPDGVLTAEMLGSGSDVEGKLKKLIAKAKAAGSIVPSSTAGN